MIYALLQTLSLILTLVWWVFNTRNQFVDAVWRIVNQVTEPILRPIRRIVPPVGGLDLSPIIVFVIIFFLQNWISSMAVTGRVI